MTDTSAKVIYHIVETAQWTSAKEESPYYPATYKADGFTHATADPKVLIGVANHFYKESKAEWICLEIETAKLKSELKWEAPAPVGDKKAQDDKGEIPKGLFPHIYGPIYPSEVSKILKVSRAENGEFLSIEGCE
eukprot:CAMPEP_0114500160 /NCGR_PEP_ID=MMETSP0109-20121206/7809_1 /TAXON_ID=29199 /ORGANISM="Chlorarachnion reptans, Strain CCCM449" /LENGTH=134 /DNA_ID=CAMNT_0001677789 /DNA_START=151 /DNA_END=555 /DNA_ORIENTATION=-